MRLLFTVLIFLLIFTTSCTTYLTGEIKKDMIATEEYPWFQKEFDDYKPDQDVVDKIKKHQQNISVVVFMGTWCSDTQRQLPRFYKIIDDMRIPIKIFALDRSKSSPKKNEETYQIKKIPTFIFFREEKEIGRIIESPTGSLEQNILDIIAE